jgi:hypothetical protein
LKLGTGVCRNQRFLARSRHASLTMADDGANVSSIALSTNRHI